MMIPGIGPSLTVCHGTEPSFWTDTIFTVSDRVRQSQTGPFNSFLTDTLTYVLLHLPTILHTAKLISAKASFFLAMSGISAGAYKLHHPYPAAI